MALLLATKTGVPCIRFQKNSNIAKRLADAVQDRIISENKREVGGTGIFSGRNTGCLVLIVDRRLDPVTPLLSQWTYQAMIHELFGIRMNRLDTRRLPAFASTGISEITLSPHDDTFLHSNRRKNYGEACFAIKEHMDR